MAGPVSNSTPETIKYNELCYPEKIKAELEKDLAKETAILVIAVVAFIAIATAAIVLTLVFAPTFLTLTVTLAGLSLPFTFGFGFALPFQKRMELLKKLKTEKDVINLLSGSKDPREIMIARATIADAQIQETLDPFKKNEDGTIKTNVETVVNLTNDTIHKLKKLTSYANFCLGLSKNPTLQNKFEETVIFETDKYDYEKKLEMYSNKITAVTIYACDKDGKVIENDKGEKIPAKEISWKGFYFRMKDEETGKINYYSFSDNELRPVIFKKIKEPTS